MSILNQRCSQYLKMTGHNSYTFARSAGLDVTKVHRLVNGSQLPAPDFFRAFCDSLRINETERKELFDLYEEETTGHAVYQNRRYITRMISNLATGEALTPSLPSASADIKNKIQAHMQICDILNEAFSRTEDKSEIYCNFPVDFSCPFFGLVLHLYQKYARAKSMRLHHIISFSSNPAVQTDSNCNLKILHQLLPLVSSGFDAYIPYYYYTHASASDFFQIPWPYYLVTEQAVLLLSSDKSSSIVHRQPEKILWYRQEMERLLRTAMPLISYSRSAEESLMLYHSHGQPSQAILGHLAYQPCMMTCMKEEQLLTNSFFSREGLLEFWKNGKISGQLAGQLPSLSPEERRNALLNFVRKNDGKTASARMMTLNIHFPSNLYIELLQNHRLLLCMFEKETNLRFMLLDESSIYDAFFDFFQYLGSEVNSLSVAGTNRFILNLLENSETGGKPYV